MRGAGLAALAALLSLLPVRAGPIATSPRLVPLGATGTTRVVRVRVSPSTVTSYALFVGTHGTVTATGAPGQGVLDLPLPPASFASPGFLVLTPSPPTGVTFGVGVYTAPTVASTGAALTTAGLSRVVVTMSAGSAPLPSDAVDVRVRCSTSPTLPATALFTAADLASPSSPFSFAVTPPEVRIGSIGSIGASQTTLTFQSQAMPATACSHAEVLLSYNGGAHWHAALPGGQALVVTAFSPLKVASLYPSDLSIRWPQSHNRARIFMAASYPSAVDASLYYEDAFDYVGDGSARAAEKLQDAITAKGADLVLVAGGEFRPAAARAAAANPNARILVMSTLRNPANYFSNTFYPNLATATGRMYEAIYHAGFVAGSTSPTGKLGMILALDHPTSYAFVNAFALGAQAAKRAGVAPVGQPPISVTSWVVGDFNLPWPERTSALDLLGRGVDVLMATTDNAEMVQSVAIAAGRKTCGFNADDRLTLGDSVLVSALYEWTPIYVEFVRRLTVNEAFGGTFFDGGVGYGVSLTGLSPAVPVAAAAATRARLAASTAEDSLEEVFCGDLKDGAGALILDGTSGAVRTGFSPSVRGFGGAYCLAAADIYDMKWTVDGVTLLGEWVAPPFPVDPAWTFPSGLRGGLYVLPIATFVLAAAATLLVTAAPRLPIIRYSSPIFLLVCNAGAVLYGAMLLFSSAAVRVDTAEEAARQMLTDEACSGALWGYGLAFAVLFGSLFAKTNRIHRLFNNRKLKKLRLPSSYVFAVLGGVLLAEVALLLVITFVFPRVAVTERVVSGGGFVTFQHCGAGGALAQTVDGQTLLSSLHFLVLLWGGYLAFRVRLVPDGFNESRYIALAIYNVATCELIGLILSPSTAADPPMAHLIGIIRLGIPPVATLLLLFVPKAYAAWKNVALESTLPGGGGGGGNANNSNFSGKAGGGGGGGQGSARVGPAPSGGGGGAYGQEATVTGARETVDEEGGRENDEELQQGGVRA